MPPPSSAAARSLSHWERVAEGRVRGGTGRGPAPPHPPLRGTFSRREKVAEGLPSSSAAARSLSHWERVAEGPVRGGTGRGPAPPHPPLRGTFSRREKAAEGLPPHPPLRVPSPLGEGGRR